MVHYRDEKHHFYFKMQIMEETRELSSILTDELTDMRVSARNDLNYKLSDLIRNELDSRGCFVIDTKDFQDVYHMGIEWANKRQEFLKDISFIRLRFRR